MASNPLTADETNKFINRFRAEVLEEINGFCFDNKMNIGQMFVDFNVHWQSVAVGWAMAQGLGSVESTILSFDLIKVVPFQLKRQELENEMPEIRTEVIGNTIGFFEHDENGKIVKKSQKPIWNI